MWLKICKHCLNEECKMEILVNEFHQFTYRGIITHAYPWCSNNVIITSKRRHADVITSTWRFDVITTLLRNVSAGIIAASGRRFDMIRYYWDYYPVLENTLVNESTSGGFVLRILSEAFYDSYHIGNVWRFSSQALRYAPPGRLNLQQTNTRSYENRVRYLFSLNDVG